MVPLRGLLKNRSASVKKKRLSTCVFRFIVATAESLTEIVKLLTRPDQIHRNSAYSVVPPRQRPTHPDASNTGTHSCGEGSMVTRCKKIHQPKNSKWDDSLSDESCIDSTTGIQLAICIFCTPTSHPNSCLEAAPAAAALDLAFHPRLFNQNNAFAQQVNQGFLDLRFTAGVYREIECRRTVAAATVPALSPRSRLR